MRLLIMGIEYAIAVFLYSKYYTGEEYINYIFIGSCIFVSGYNICATIRDLVYNAKRIIKPVKLEDIEDVVKGESSDGK